MFDVAVPVGAFLALRRDRIHVGRIQRGGLGNAGAPCLLGQPLEQVGRASTALMVENCAQRVDPFARLDGVKILHAFHLVLPLAFPRLLFIGWARSGRIRAKEHGPLPNATNPFHLQAFFAHRYIVGSFVCAKIRNNDVCNVGKSKSLGGCGTCRLRPDCRTTRAQVFRQTARAIRSLSCAKRDFDRKIRNFPGASALSLKHGPVLAGASSARIHWLPAPNAAEWSGRIRQE